MSHLSLLSLLDYYKSIDIQQLRSDNTPHVTLRLRVSGGKPARTRDLNPLPLFRNPFTLNPQPATLNPQPSTLRLRVSGGKPARKRDSFDNLLDMSEYDYPALAVGVEGYGARVELRVVTD